MSDIVERLRALEDYYSPRGAHPKIHYALKEATDLIEHQAAEIDDLTQRLISGSEHDLRERIRLQAEIEQLRAELNGRLGQPFGDPAKT